MDKLSKIDPNAAWLYFTKVVIDALEQFPIKRKKRCKKYRPKIDKKRRLLWRKLAKVQRKINCSRSVEKISKLLENKRLIQSYLSEDYYACSAQQENETVQKIKSDPKQFYNYVKSKQNTKTKIGPFLDPDTGYTNSDPDFAANILSKGNITFSI